MNESAVLPPGRLLLPLLLAMIVSSFLASPGSAQVDLQCLELPLPAGCQTFAFDIELTSLIDSFGIFGPALVDDVLSGTFTTFEDHPDLDGDPGSGQYLNAVECVRLDLGDRDMVVVLTPVEISLPQSQSDPGVLVMNDTPQAAGGFTLFADSASFLMAGPGGMLLDPTPTEISFPGAGGFSFGYADACIAGIETPCPRTLVMNDDFPSAPGDTTGIDTAQMTFDYLALSGFSATANADILAIDPASPVPCPEPGFSSAMMGGLLMLGLLGRRRLGCG